MRMHGHAAHDDMRYVPTELVERWASRDPIALQEERAKAAGADVEALRAEVVAQVDEATEAALAMPMPEPAAGARGRLRRAMSSISATATRRGAATPRGRRRRASHRLTNGDAPSRRANGKAAA